MLQAGDCAESFHDYSRLTETGAAYSAVAIRERLQIMLQMAAVLTYGAALPVLKVGRIAGQYVKPRSASTEQTPDGEIPVFRGHMVNDDAATAAARVPDPQRMLQGYYYSAAALNLCAGSPRVASPISSRCTHGTRTSSRARRRASATS